MMASWYRSLQRWERLFILVLFLLSLGLRLGYLAEIRKTPFLEHLRLDELFHHNWARSIASGNVLGDDVFFRAPGYPYWLGFLYTVFGQSYIIPRLIQHVLGSISVILLYDLARNIFGRNVAIVSSSLMATYSALIYMEDKFLLEAILPILLIVLFLSFHHAAERPAFSRWFAVGILFGLCCITRPVLLPCVLLLLIPEGLLKLKSEGWTKGRSKLLGVALGVVFVILPISLRNYIVGGDFVLIASQGGLNFFIGNNSSADGFSSSLPGGPGLRWEYRDVEYLAERGLGHKARPSEVSSYFYGEGIRFALSHPLEFLRISGKKLYLFWNHIEIPNNNSFYTYAEYSSILTELPIGFWLIGPLGILGLWIAWKEKLGQAMVTFVVIYTTVSILFFVCDRFRVPLVPILCLFSGVALVRIWEKRRSHSKQWMFKHAALLLTVGIFTNSNLVHVSRASRSLDLFRFGNIEVEKGNYTAAVSYFEEAGKEQPELPDLHLNWAVAEWNRGAIESAIQKLREELKLFPESYDALSNLAHVFYVRKEYDSAAHYAQQAIAVKPYATAAFVDLAFIYSAVQKLNAAESVMVSCLGSGGENALYEESVLASIHLTQGKIYLAEREYHSILSRLKTNRQPRYEPEYEFSQDYKLGGDWKKFQAKVLYSLGHIFVERGQLDSALAYFKHSTIVWPEFSDGWSDVGKTLLKLDRLAEADTSFVRSLRIDPRNAEHWYSYGLLLATMGRMEEARPAFQNAMALDSNLSGPKEALNLLLYPDSSTSER